MNTNEERIQYLQKRLNQLSSKIEKQALEDEYLEMAEQIKDGSLKFEPLTEEHWQLMLPKEKNKNLLVHYHTLRSELHTMKIAGKKETRKGKLRAWLESPWVQVGLSALTIAEAAITVVEMAHQSGLFFKEEKDTDYLA